jgi:serine-type D-Ala-D-Ala carboxypeptidase (penicillin-binding protein 5/6)
MPSRRLPWLVISLLSCLSVAFGPPVLTESDCSRRSLTAQQLGAMHQIPPPELTAASAIMVNTTTGQILYARNEHEHRAPASLTKMVTALVALQRGRLDQEIRVADTDLAVGSAAYMQLGELINLRDLLHMLLIPSDNAAGMTIARGLGKDVPTFVGWMNDLVASWGLSDTHFTNPHGLDSKNEYTTAYDMAIISLYAMRNPTFADIVGRYDSTAGGRAMVTTNELLNKYPGMIGIKTGTTDNAGQCFAAMVNRPAGKVLTVVMGSTDRFVDTQRLLDYFYTNFAELRIDLPQTPQNRYLDENNTWHDFGLREPTSVLISPWQVNSVSFYRRIDTPSANPNPDQPIGVLQVNVADKPLTEVPIYAR